MKPFLTSLFLFVWCSVAFANTLPEKPYTLQYTIQKRDSNSLLIQVSFPGNSSGKTILNLPNQWASERELYKGIADIKSLSASMSVNPTEKPDQYVITHKPGARVAVSYILSKTWTGPLMYPKYFRPIIEKDYYHFEGYSGLAYPDIEQDKKITCTISHIGFSKTDFIGNSFFSLSNQKKFKTTLANLLNGVYCAGNYRYKEIKDGNNTILVAIHGKFNYQDEQVYAGISKILIDERKFWRDTNHPYFFTSLISMDDQNNGGGTAHFNSFNLFQSSNVESIQALSYLIHHEYLHTWIGQGLRMPAPEEIYKWFSEGFTDYFTYKIQRLTGSISDAGFKQKINEIILNYYLSGYSTTNNTQLIGRYWENPSLKILSYQRGTVEAFMLDLKIQEKNSGSSLDDLMRELYQNSKPDLLFSKQSFDQLVLKYADQSVLSAIDSANAGLNNLLTQQLQSNPVIEFKTFDKLFDLGFNLSESSKARKIAGVVAGSNAEKAGLSENMEFTGYVSIWNGNVEKPAKIEVIKNGVKTWIEYIPVKAIKILVPQVILEQN